MPDERTSQHEQEPELSPEAQNAIRELFGSGPGVPPEIDERLLATVRAQMPRHHEPEPRRPAHRPERRPRRLRFAGAGMLVAASLAIAATVVVQSGVLSSATGPSSGSLAVVPDPEADSAGEGASEALLDHVDLREQSRAEEAPASKGAPADSAESDVARDDDVGYQNTGRSAPAPASMPTLMAESEGAGAAIERRARQVRPTMLDAFRVASALKDRRAVDARWDVTGDGVIDARDVEAIAKAAVALPAEEIPGGAS